MAVIAIPNAGALRTGAAGREATLQTNHFLAAVAAIRAGVPAAAVFAATGFVLGTQWAWWAATRFITFAASAALASEVAWLRFRLAHFAVTFPVHRHGGVLPGRLIAFLQDGIRPERATLRVNGTAWQFRHALIQDHLTNSTRPIVLRRLADAGDGSAAWRLAQILRERGYLDEAVAMLRRAADAGDGSAARELAEALREQGNVDEAVATLRRRADAGDGLAARELALLLWELS